jgi:membrane-associated protease RseP (regulator of RpoE activity)
MMKASKRFTIYYFVRPMTDLETLNKQFYSPRRAMRPTALTWLKHAGWFLLTFFTVTVAGLLEPFGPLRILPDADPQTSAELILFFQSLPLHYVKVVGAAIQLLATNSEALIIGLSFSVPLLFVLVAHEFGHYIACRIYGVDATLPYFIPMPPMIGPAGTLGAFIRILSPLPSRRATFDIGVAGPIAGFVALIPVLVIGLLTMEQVPPEVLAAAQGERIYFSDPLLTHLLGALIGVSPSHGVMNPFLAAAWVGLLITSLNLIPSGQLDGGHAVFSVFGERVHYWTGRIAFVVMIGFSVIGWLLYTIPGALLFTLLLGIMMRMRHPEPIDDTPLDRRRLAVAFLTLVIFALAFTPFPIKIVGGS